ncbi:tyrosine-protein kinase Fer-like [Uloborus diversus]|uniref:tyrosine-protein kinase Fer-like n=1 Tax=Uloborus diversus TaxID=327109 RepID=UPI002409FAE5|nr:tyrosine-protein kinase Fer-like [Uloborus diversus]
MGFSTDLQDAFSHEALVGLQDAELKLLENMKKCVLLRAKCDRDYASSLTMVSNQALKLDLSKELEGSSIARAWYAISEEMDIMSKIIRRNADCLTSSTIEAINNLISEKRALKNLYVMEHDTLHGELSRLHNSVESMKTEYEKYLEMWKEAKSKYEEQYIKGKGARKVEDAKERYQKSAKKLHVLHNELILTLCEASEYERHFRTTLIPGLLYYQQTVMEDSAETWKSVLQEYFEVINLTSEQFQAVHTRMSKSIEVIDSEDEYTDFICKNRSDPLQPIDFKYDVSLLKDITGPLRPNELIADDFTMDILLDKKKELESKLIKCEKDLLKMQEDLQQYEDEIKLSQFDNRDCSNLRVKKRAVDILVKNLSHSQCIEHILHVQLHLVNFALSCIDNDTSPSELEHNDQKACSQNSSNEQKEDFNVTLSRKSKFIMDKLKQPFFTLKQRHVSACPPSPPNKDFLDNVVETERVTFKKEIKDTSYQNEDWFHGVLPREEVVRLLVNDGDFLLRETVRYEKKQLVLSVCSQGYKHFIVHMTSDKKYRFEGPNFDTIQELIMHQFQSGQPVTMKSGAILKRPIARERWELNNDDVELIEKIGSGNFGDVYRAQLENYREVAVKTCHVNLPDAQKRNFLQEGRILMDYNHPNIVKFIGICVQKHPIMIVMELVPGGSLLNFLQKHNESLTLNQLLSFCIDAAAGMEYLESKNCIHRDLAARNCLVDVNNIVKISDFGMSRKTIEYVVTDGMKQIPIKWTAPEALNYGIYTTLCDVWSYGILMWEIFSLGSVPYLGLSNNKATEMVENGYRLQPPDNTPPEIYEIMRKCWEYDPQKRPHFGEIHSSLNIFAGSTLMEDTVEL